MGRFRVLATWVLLLLAAVSFATDYRLVIASDDPGTRKAGAIVIFEPSGRLTKEDRITSITFSAAADVKENCLISLDPASGKAALALSPDVEVYKGKVMVAGTKPTRKVIPAHIEIDTPVGSSKSDGKLSSVMQPIIQQVNNLPWVYIALGVGIFMAVMYLMNRRSYQFTTSMSKEAKNLYMETVGRISDRLDRIEASQERLVKNPPVVRTFKTQIEDFEGRLGRIEKLAKEGRDEVGRAAAELSQSDKRHDDLVGRIESAKGEASKTQASLKQEADALRAELKLLLKSQDEANSKLNTLEELKASSLQIAEQNRALEVKLSAQEELLTVSRSEHGKQLQQLHAELATIRTNQESLLSMPRELELVSAGLAKMPAEFESVRSAMPRLDGIETKLDGIAGFAPKLDRFDGVEARLDSIAGFAPRFDEISGKLDALPEIKDSLEALPSQFPKSDDELARIHESLKSQIEGLSGKVESSSASLEELISAHSFAVPAPESTSEHDQADLSPGAKRSKKGKAAKSEKPEEVLEEAVATEEEFKPEAVAEAPVEEFIADLEPEAVAEEPLLEEPQSFQEAESAQPEALEIEEPVLEAETQAADQSEQFEEAQVESESPSETPEAEPVLEAEAVEEPEVAAEVSEEEAFELTAEPIEFETQQPEEELVEAFDESAQECLELVVEEFPEQSSIPEEAATLHVAEVEEPADLVSTAVELEYRYAEPDPAPIAEFHFNNAIKRMTEEEQPMQIQEESHRAGREAPLTFHLEELPTHLETFEDEEPDAVLSTLRIEDQDLANDSAGAKEAVELVLRQLDQPKSANEDLEAFDHEAECDSHDGHWGGLGGSSARTWSSNSSLPLNPVTFEGELKPMTPIETAPPGDLIGGMISGSGRVIYACGSSIHGFWPGKDDRHCSLDLPVPAEEWRLAIKGQNLFVAGEKRVKITSVQGWFVLEQFSGEYHDQLLTDTRWVGLRKDEGPVLDFRDFRGQMAAEGVRLNVETDGLLLCANAQHVFAGSKDGQIMQVSEFGTEQIGRGPDGGELVHLTVWENAPLAVYRSGDHLECWHFGAQTRSASLETESYDGHPVLLGNKLYLANVAASEVIGMNLKKMQRSSTTAFAGVESVRRIIGVQHKSQHDLFAITNDEGKKGGRVVMIDVKAGIETTLCSVGQAGVNLISADCHLVLSNSSQYQNVIRVLEPFSHRIAA